MMASTLRLGKLTVLATILAEILYRTSADDSVISNIVPSCIFGPDTIHFVLYNEKTPNGQDVYDMQDADLGIIAYEKLYMLIHGFISEANNTNMYEFARELAKQGNQPVISIDWSNQACGASMSILDVVAYGTAKNNTQGVGKKVANFIVFLNKEYGIPPSNVVCIGHSLGAHVCGFAGKELKKLTNETVRIGTIVGLDPAGPLFDGTPASNKLVAGDASLVEVMHTSTLYGTHESNGDFNVFVNNGQIQPGCLDQICSHSFSVLLLQYMICPGCDFVGTRCPSGRLGCLWSYLFPPSVSECTKENCVFFGRSMPKNTARGLFSMITTDHPPYCKANSTVIMNCSKA